MTPSNPTHDTDQNDITPGARFRRAREDRGMSVEAAAAALRVPVRVVRAIEADDAARLGARVFVRGHVGAYARVLGLPCSVVDEVCREHPEAAPPLITMAPSTRFQRFTESLARRAVYIVLTATIVVPAVWIATDRSAGSRLSLSPLDTSPVAVPVVDAAPVMVRPSQPMVIHDLPVVASFTPFYGKAAAASQDGPHESADGGTMTPDPVGRDGEGWLSLHFKGESWVEIFDAQGRRIEQALLRDGDMRHYAKGQVGRITLGNAGAVDVKRDGQSVDLAPFQRANVARFTVSSDGSMAGTGG